MWRRRKDRWQAPAAKKVKLRRPAQKRSARRHSARLRLATTQGTGKALGAMVRSVRLRSVKGAKRPPIVNVILTAGVLAGAAAEAAAAVDFRNQNSIPAMRRRGSKKDTKKSRRLVGLRVTSRSSCPAKASPSI